MVDRQVDFSLDSYLDCFGQYQKDDPVCRRRCAVNLRCAIEQDQNERFEIVEDLVTTGGMMMRIN